MKPIQTLDDVARGLSALKELDPRLIPVIESAGPVPLRLREPSLGSLMKIVVSQQVSVQSAAAIWGRFEAVFDPATPQHIATAKDEDMQAVGLSRPKIKTLRAIAIEALENGLDCPALMGKPLEVVNHRLTSIHGVGPWTAEVFALFCLGHPDIFPVGDVALQHGVHQAFQLNERPKGDVLTSIAEQWSPWRGVAARLFWAYYATYKNRDALPV
ncbi:MAG: DNA-3-methyladenine glycosylase 2 family protein [Hyphomicrobiales bacterium]